MAKQWIPSESSVGAWFQVRDCFGDGLFLCKEIQKNGGMKGLIVYTNDGRCKHRSPRTKHYSTGKLFDGDQVRWVKLTEDKVPKEYIAAAT